MRTSTLAAVSLLALACIMRAPQPLPVSATQDWVNTLTFAQRSAAEGRFGAADSALAAFASRTADSPEANEAHYWRALYLLDPANGATDRRQAIRYLDAYLAAGNTATYRNEARVLRRLASSVDSLAQAALAAETAAAEQRNATAERPPSPREEELQKEVQRLRDSLDRTNAEMDRIKRRLTPPKRPN